MAEPSLRRRWFITLALFSVSLVVFMGATVHMLAERQERVVWRALLQLEMEVFAEHLSAGIERPSGAGQQLHAYHWPIDEPAPAHVPAPFHAARERVDEDVMYQDREFATLAREVDGQHLVVALDITSFEVEETRLIRLTAIAMLVAIALLLMASHFLAGALLRPVTDLARAVGALDPTRRGARLRLTTTERELASIAGAIDGYLERLDGFVQREHEFIASASHELRTPVAVIAGATEILREKAGDDERCAALLKRIEQGIVDIDETLSTLLYLATEPEAAPPGTAPCPVDELLPGLVRDHEHLLAGKPQRVVLGTVEPVAVHAPQRMVYIAIGNLLRNAIQHGHAGTVTMTLTGGVLRIVDEGPGMTPEQVARAYSAGARHASSGRAGGLGLHIVQRIAQRQGWTLEFDSVPGRGTAVALDLRPSSAA
jgi:signal transduction histidine kinase